VVWQKFLGFKVVVNNQVIWYRLQ